MSEAQGATVDANPGAAASRDGGAVRYERERRAERRHDVPDSRSDLVVSSSGGQAHALVPAHAPALVPVHAPTLAAPSRARPKAEREPLEEPTDEHREPVALRSSADPRPPPPGIGARLQRTSLPELFMAMVTPDRDEAGGLLVEDGAQTLTSGQLRKGEFMRALRVEVCRVAEEELRRAGRSAAGCPYIDQMLSYYEGRSAEHLERAIRRYAPETRRVRDARDYLPPLSARLGRGIAQWARTGQMPEDVPNETLAALAGARSGLVGVIAGLAGLSRKASAGGGEPGTIDAGAVVRQLGPGQALEGGTRARMERALGHSFADVRIHADERAAMLNRDLAARAFTIGPHVAFGAGELQPGTVHGDALLAHELAHVIQQGTAAPAGEVPVGTAADPLEQDADLAAAAAVARLHGGLHQAARRPRWRAVGGGLRLQRCGPSPTGPRTTDDVQEYNRLVAALRSTFGVEVRDGTAQWRPFQLERVHEALTLLSPAERAIIRGSTLVRVDHTGQRIAGHEAHAYFELGTFSPPNEQPPERRRNLNVSNAAVELQPHEMVGLIVHELGHGLEKHARQEAQFALETTTAALNRGMPAAQAALNALGDAHNAAYRRVNGYSARDQTACAPFLEAFNDATLAIRALGFMAEADASRRPALEAAATQALVARDAARARLAASSPQNPALNDFAAAIAAQDAAIVVARERARLVEERVSRMGALAAVTATLGTEQISTRLMAFITVVRQHGIGAITPYARMVLDVAGETEAYYEELYAEAFRLYRTERATLEASAPDLVPWFDAGNHLR